MQLCVFGIWMWEGKQSCKPGIACLDVQVQYRSVRCVSSKKGQDTRDITGRNKTTQGGQKREETEKGLQLNNAIIIKREKKTKTEDKQQTNNNRQEEHNKTEKKKKIKKKKKTSKKWLPRNHSFQPCRKVISQPCCG